MTNDQVPKKRAGRGADVPRNELLEIYKLHSELADRLNQRRDGTNRLYVSLFVGLTGLLVALSRFGGNDASLAMGLRAVGIAGVWLSTSWYAVIRSYRYVDTDRHQVLRELEQRLAYPFLTREQELRSGSDPRSRCFEPTVVEVVLPRLFVLPSIVVLVLSLFVDWNG